MIRLLAVYPGMDRKAEMLYSLQALKQFEVETIVIAGRSEGLHGTGYRPRYEDYDSLKVFRLYRDLTEMFVCTRLHQSEALAIAQRFDPDIVLASQEMTTRLAVNLATELGVPLALWVESSLHDLATGRLKVERRVPDCLLLSIAGMPPTMLAWWNWIFRHCAAIITCNPSDKPYLDYLRRSGKIIEYIPWPIGLDMESIDQLRTLTKKRYGIYAGSFLKMKNIREFSETIPQILNYTPTEKFMFIGHGEEEKVIMGLRQQFGDRILHVRDLPKKKVVELIASAWYAYTPAKRYGSWQFIGDCWALGTPIITTYESGYTDNGYNGVTVPPSEIVPAINRFFSDQEFYRRLVRGGFATANSRHPKRIASRLFSVIEECLNRHA